LRGARITRGRVRVERRSFLPATATTSTATTPIATATLVGPIGVAGLLWCPISPVIVRSIRIGGHAAFRRWAVLGPGVLAIALLASSSVAAFLRRPRFATGIGTAPLLVAVLVTVAVAILVLVLIAVAILIATRGLTVALPLALTLTLALALTLTLALTLRPGRLGCASPALRLGSLLLVVGTPGTPPPVAEPSLALATRAMGVEFLLGAPGDLAAA
jgi:hypothetical protein